jgi:sorting nexin-8
LLPPSTEANFYQILGLIALELSVPGTGDYVTLQFKLTNLPELPKQVVDDLCSTRAIVDPLGVLLENTTLEDDKLQTNWDEPDPLLTDHSDTFLQQHQDVKHSPVKKIHNQVPIDTNSINKYIDDIRDKFKPLLQSADAIKIKEIPEKEGLLFKHVNYVITHDLKLGMNSAGGTKKVIRRYSDFVWLLDFLLKKYPFRIIPGLPPKKFTVGSSPDSQFLQRRRRGLHRFLNQLVKHPVLKQEPIVITFLSLPTDIVTWKKQAKIDYSIEFKGEKIMTDFINSIWPTIGQEMLKNWSNCENSITKLIETWTKIVILVERHEKRQQQQAYDNSKFVEMLNLYKATNGCLYPNDEDSIIGQNNRPDINTINDSLTGINQFFTKSSQVLIDESYMINNEINEKFKNYLDYLYSMQELFERTKRLSANNIEQLERQIKEKEAKFNKLNNEDVDASGTNLAKLRQSIIDDKQQIFQELNRDWLIKKCCLEEFLMIQETQYLISELWVDWNKSRFRTQEKLLALQDDLNNQIVNDMPFGK